MRACSPVARQGAPRRDSASCNRHPRRLLEQPVSSRRGGPARSRSPTTRSDAARAQRAAPRPGRSAARASRASRSARTASIAASPLRRLDQVEGERLAPASATRPGRGPPRRSPPRGGRRTPEGRWRWRDAGDIRPLGSPALGAREDEGAIDRLALGDVAGEGVAVAGVAQVVGREAHDLAVVGEQIEVLARSGSSSTTVPRGAVAHAEASSRFGGRPADRRSPTRVPRPTIRRSEQKPHGLAPLARDAGSARRRRGGRGRASGCARASRSSASAHARHERDARVARVVEATGGARSRRAARPRRRRGPRPDARRPGAAARSRWRRFSVSSTAPRRSASAAKPPPASIAGSWARSPTSTRRAERQAAAWARRSSARVGIIEASSHDDHRARRDGVLLSALDAAQQERGASATAMPASRWRTSAAWPCQATPITGTPERS